MSYKLTGMKMPRIGNKTDPIISIKTIKFGTFIHTNTEKTTKSTLIKYFNRKLLKDENLSSRFLR